MIIEFKNINEIKPYEKNPRRNDSAVDIVAKSIQEFGFKNPIIIDNDNVIVCGHTRYKAAQKLNMENVPCIYASDLNAEQIKAFRLVDNKTHELSEWDFDLLEFELENINIDLSDYNFELYSENEKDIVEDNFNCEIPPEPKSKYGDIYELGNHRLMCGDSTIESEVQKLTNGNKADMVLTDPPYGMFLDTDFSSMKGYLKSIGIKNKTTGKIYDKVIGDNDDFSPELINTIFLNFEYAKEIFIFGADFFAELIPNRNDGSWLVWDKRKESQSEAFGSEFELIWSKQKHKRRMLRHDWFGFLSSANQQDAKNRVHPTQKPITLLTDIIQQFGNYCSNILDLYGGSGSTLIACEQTNRKCYMMELDPKYVDVIVKRYIDFVGSSASVKLIRNGEEIACQTV